LTNDYPNKKKNNNNKKVKSKPLDLYELAGKNNRSFVLFDGDSTHFTLPKMKAGNWWPEKPGSTLAIPQILKGFPKSERRP
jgi:hypothetical protein